MSELYVSSPRIHGDKKTRRRLSFSIPFFTQPTRRRGVFRVASPPQVNSNGFKFAVVVLFTFSISSATRCFGIESAPERILVSARFC